MISLNIKIGNKSHSVEYNKDGSPKESTFFSQAGNLGKIKFEASLRHLNLRLLLKKSTNFSQGPIFIFVLYAFLKIKTSILTFTLFSF